MEKAQRGGADGERARRKPGQQTQPALLTAAVVRIGLLVVLVILVLGGFCVRDKIFSSEMNVAVGKKVVGQRSNHFLLVPLTADTKAAPQRRLINHQDTTFLRQVYTNTQIHTHSHI